LVEYRHCVTAPPIQSLALGLSHGSVCDSPIPLLHLRQLDQRQSRPPDHEIHNTS
jgi:hypothetical protein